MISIALTKGRIEKDAIKILERQDSELMNSKIKEEN